MTMPKAGRLILLLPDRPIANSQAGNEPVSLFTPPDLECLSAWLHDFANAAASPETAAQAHAVAATLNDHGFLEVLPDWEQAPSGLRGKLVLSGLPAEVFLCAECGSTFDLAWVLAEHGLLSAWDAVLAMRQSAGRGQLRRRWHSPAGNLHVSFRLPDWFFGQEAASVLTALLLIRAFESRGLGLKLKWPNDLVLFKESMAGKLGGILLEERSGRLVAGAGINCAYRPDSGQLRKDAAMDAALLPEAFSARTPLALWSRLVYDLILMYKKTFQATSVKELLYQAENYLLWKGSEVQVRDHYEEGSAITGILRGLTELGGLRLLVSGAAVHSAHSPPGLQSPQNSPARSCSPALRGEHASSYDLASYDLDSPEEISIYSGSVKKR